MCRLYGVTRGGYYAWRQRGHSNRAQEDEVLRLEVRQIFEKSHGIYGSPRIQEALAEADKRHSRKRIARLMAEEGLEGRCMRIYRSNAGQHRFFQNIEKQCLDQATGPDQVWVGDVTYLNVAGKWRFLAVVMDWYSRKILGWSLGNRRTVALTVRALNQAYYNRRPSGQVVFHSDRGMEYVGNAFRNRIDKLGFIQSINRPGCMNDNARMESFFGSMKSEWLHGLKFDSDEVLRTRIRSYIPFYNYERLHSSLGYRSPVEFEELTNN